MRRIPRIVMLATLIAIAPAISGCADFDLDKLDVFHLNEKKKLPGKRELLFPNGVPGVSQGIPPEYQKGYQPQPDQTADAAPGQPGAAPANNANGAKPGEQRTAAVTPVESKPAPKAKPKPKPHVRHKVKRKPKPKAAEPKPVSQPQQSAPWPAPAQQQDNSAPWPAAQPSTPIIRPGRRRRPPARSRSNRTVGRGHPSAGLTRG